MSKVWETIRKIPHLLSLGLLRDDARGLYFNQITWNFLVRPVASLLTSGFYTSVLWGLGEVVGFQVLNGWWLVAFVAILTIAVAWNDSDQAEEVPEFYGLISTIFGVPVRIIRVNGRYGWSGKYTFLGEVDVVRVKKDKDGKDIGFLEGTRGKYVYLGEFPIAIWNSVSEKGMTLLSSLAKDGSTLYSTLVYNLRLKDPVMWVRNEDPVLVFAERARSALRNAVMYFTLRDGALVRNAVSSLMNGFGVATAFIRKAEGGHKAGSIVRDRGDVPILERFSDNGQTLHGKTIQNKEAAESALIGRIRSTASESMRKLVSENGEVDGEIDVEFHSVEESVDEILEMIGAVIVSASIGQIHFSKIVEDAANATASEEWQLEGQVMSAEAAGLYAAKLREHMPTDREPTKLDELQVVLGAAQDNPSAVKVTWVGGQYDAIGSSIVAAGQQLAK